MTISIRRTEPSDYESVAKVLAGPKAVRGTLQLPFPSVETWRKRLAEPPAGLYGLVACVDDEVVGHLGLHTFPDNPRRRHVGQIGMAVRDDWQGKGVGTALMQAAVELADKWLNLERLELDVFIDYEPAFRSYKKFGFSVEGTLSRFAFRDGEYVDAYIMARLAHRGSPRVRPAWHNQSSGCRILHKGSPKVSLTGLGLGGCEICAGWASFQRLEH